MTTLLTATAAQLGDCGKSDLISVDAEFFEDIIFGGHLKL
jgi:hypothetical protein